MPDDVSVHLLRFTYSGWSIQITFWHHQSKKARKILTDGSSYLAAQKSTRLSPWSDGRSSVSVDFSREISNRRAPSSVNQTTIVSDSATLRTPEKHSTFRHISPPPQHPWSKITRTETRDSTIQLNRARRWQRTMFKSVGYYFVFKTKKKCCLFACGCWVVSHGF